MELAGSHEGSALEVMGLEIEDKDEGDGELLLQPCRALKGRRCSIYAHRPDCCRMFACRLLQEVKRGAVTVGQAQGKIAETLRRIERVNELIVHLGPANEHLPLKERCGEALALSEEADADPVTNRKHAELELAMTSVETLIEATFLGARRRCGIIT